MAEGGNKMNNSCHIVDPLVESYIRSLLKKREGLLEDLENFAFLHHVPIVHPEVAQYLKVMCALNKPRSILEIGTAIGYSASVMALEMGVGSIDTIELNETNAELAKKTFNELGKLVPDVQVNLHEGDAREVIPNLNKTFDWIFIDAAKGHYKAFLDLCLPLLNEGGMIISDNVLYKGMVASNHYLVRRKITIVKRMRRYLEHISQSEELETTILPIGDGLAMTLRKRGEDA